MNYLFYSPFGGGKDDDEESRCETPIEPFIVPANAEDVKERRRQRADQRRRDQEAMAGKDGVPLGPNSETLDDDDPSKSQILDEHLREGDEDPDTAPQLDRASIENSEVEEPQQQEDGNEGPSLDRLSPANTSQTSLIKKDS